MPAPITSAETARQPAAGPLGRVGPWELVEAIGQGPLTRAYRARPAGANQGQAAYVVKVLRRHWEDDPQAVAAIRREALAGQQVAHSNLAPVLSAHVAGPPYYVALPWLEGMTLEQRLKAVGRLPVALALWHARQAAAALAALHHAGWMHGDVKPANLLVSGQGHLTLLDLGCARRADDASGLHERPVQGTMHYLAPEMATSAWGGDIRSDVYSLGATLYELLAGRPPFDARDLGELVRQHHQDRAPRLHALAPCVPPEVESLVREMLAKQPLRRPQTPAELVERLARLEIASFAQRHEAGRKAVAS